MWLFRFRALQLDHINGGGTKERKTYGTTLRYMYYLKHPREANQILQVLCANCNWVKKYEMKEWSNFR